VRKGDTIVTGGQSDIFPENIGVGTIDKAYIDNISHFYTLKIKLFNDMTNLGHVYVIKNKDRQEILDLEAKNKPNE
jgi:rod shape-determining protein MreC